MLPARNYAVTARKHPSALPDKKYQPNQRRRPKLRLSAVRKAVLVGVVICLAAVAFVIVYRFSMINQLRSEIADLEKELHDVRMEYNQLSLEIARLKNPDRIRKLASEKCGLIIPEQDQFISVSSPGSP